MRIALATAIVLATAGTAAAEPPTWTVRTFSVEHWLGDSSATTLATAPISGGGAAVERRALRMDLPGPFHPLDVTAELGFDTGATDGTTFDQLQNHIRTWELTAGARARLPILSWLHLQGRAAVGGAHTRVRIADRAMSETAIADSGNGMVAGAGLGLAVLPRLTPSDRGAFHLGVEIELGYQASTATTIHAYPENRPAEDLTIPSRYASLGDLDLDGWTLRMGVTIGF